jgi:hypothetical protein
MGVKYYIFICCDLSQLAYLRFLVVLVTTMISQGHMTRVNFKV